MCIEAEAISALGLSFCKVFSITDFPLLSCESTHSIANVLSKQTFPSLRPC